MLDEEHQITQLLNRHYPFFEPELQQEILESSSLKKFNAHTTILSPGQYFKATLLLVEGGLKIYRENEDGKEFLMYELLPGEACALSLVCASKNVKSEVLAKTTGESTALLVPNEKLDIWARKYKSWYYFVLESYRSRFEELLEVIDHVAFKKLDERLENYLDSKVNTTGNSDITITHQEIANDLNTSREVISRLLKSMEQQGSIKLERNLIRRIKRPV